MASKWLTYFSAVKSRTHFDAHFIKDARVVAGLYTHFKWGKGRQTFAADAKRPTLAFFPDPVGPWYNIWLILNNTPIKVVKDAEEADYVFIFDDKTKSRAADNLPPNIEATRINDKITDISKFHVGEVFNSVFGYDIGIDPTKFEGKAVEKSDENGVHDGRIITCPIPESEMKSGYCYQRFIDSSFSGETSEDLRIACVFGEVAAVFHKHKAFDKIFSTSYLNTTVHTAQERFSPEELSLIKTFCAAMGLDFGAIDVMRDKSDGRIYIVDVNKTCMPVLSLPPAEQYRSLKMIAQSFEDNLPKPRAHKAL